MRGATREPPGPAEFVCVGGFRKGLRGIQRFRALRRAHEGKGGGSGPIPDGSWWGYRGEPRGPRLAGLSRPATGSAGSLRRPASAVLLWRAGLGRCSPGVRLASCDVTKHAALKHARVMGPANAGPPAPARGRGRARSRRQASAMARSSFARRARLIAAGARPAGCPLAIRGRGPAAASPWRCTPCPGVTE